MFFSSLPLSSSPPPLPTSHSWLAPSSIWCCSRFVSLYFCLKPPRHSMKCHLNSIWNWMPFHSRTKTQASIVCSCKVFANLQSSLSKSCKSKKKRRNRKSWEKNPTFVLKWNSWDGELVFDPVLELLHEHFRANSREKWTWIVGHVNHPIERQ